MNTRTIHQVVIIEAPPSEVYNALMDSERHSQFTGSAARISRETGGNFTVMESLRGRNLQLVPDEKIVQAWRCDYEGWPKDHFSTVTIRLEATAGGTRLEFEQTGVPTRCFRAIYEAWHKYYWLPLKKMFHDEAAVVRAM